MEEVLAEDRHRPVVRVGDTVRRTMYPWSGSVHLLLQHLESVGFAAAPRFLGVDDKGREVLSYVEGICGADGSDGPGSGAHVWAMVVPDDGLERFARSLRDYHDAVAGFAPPADSQWAIGSGPPGPGEIVCHNDIGPWNVVWREATPVCFIDWDYAAPGLAIDDIAYALWWSIPFASDEECVTWRRFTDPPNRRHRIEVFAAAYGLTSVDGLVDAVVARQRKFRATVVEHAARGIPGAVEEVASGYLDTVDGWIEWSESNRDLIANETQRVSTVDDRVVSKPSGADAPEFAIELGDAGQTANVRSVEVVPALLEDKGVLRQLVELYMYDFSEFNDRDVTDHGLFGYRYLDHYWTEPDRHPFLFRVDGHWAGFALVRTADASSIAEFFVLRKYRRDGVGTAAARAIFEKFPGPWTIEQIAENADARTFWHHAIPTDFTETTTDEGWTQAFTVTT